MSYFAIKLEMANKMVCKILLITITTTVDIEQQLGSRHNKER